MYRWTTSRGFGRQLRRRLWTLLAVAMIPGCSDSGDPTGTGDEDPSQDPRVAVATPAGGRLEFLGGEVTLVLPEGAVAGEVSITVDSVASGIPASGVPGGVFRFGPAGLEFDEPVLLTVRYPREAVPEGFNPAALRLHDFTSGTPELLLGSLHDADGATVSAEIEHFSDYGAGEASTTAVAEAIAELFSRVEEGRLELLDRYRESLERDLALTEPALDSACIESKVLAEKIALLNQLQSFEYLKDQFDVGEPSSIAGLCGGLLDPNLSVLEVSPIRSTMAPETTQQFTGVLKGPGGQVLEGPIRWASDDAMVLEVDSITGLATALEPGEASLFAFSPLLTEPFLQTMLIVVFDELDVVVEPSHIEVGFYGTQDMVASIVNTATGEVQDGAIPIFRILDDEVVAFTGTTSDLYSRQVQGRSVGTTSIEVCARVAEATETEFCAYPTVEVFPDVSGAWDFDETLEVDVDPPGTESCTVRGQVQVSQMGRTYFGTTEETVTCTYDPGDGSEPEVFEEVVQGELRNGVITGSGFYHEVFYGDEACRASGTLVRGGETASNIFVSGSGTTECLDELDFYSVGPLSLVRSGYDTSPRRPEG